MSTLLRHLPVLPIVLPLVSGALLLFLPQPGIAAALSLMLTVILIAFSRFKFDILQLSITFLDFLMVGRDTLKRDSAAIAPSTMPLMRVSKQK